MFFSWIKDYIGLFLSFILCGLLLDGEVSLSIHLSESSAV